MFILGMVIGILICVFIVIIEIYLSRSQRLLSRLEKVIPKQKGSIIELESEEKQRIDKIIKENDSKGIDTPLVDLYDDTE